MPGQTMRCLIHNAASGKSLEVVFNLRFSDQSHWGRPVIHSRVTSCIGFVESWFCWTHRLFCIWKARNFTMRQAAGHDQRRSEHLYPRGYLRGYYQAWLIVRILFYAVQDPRAGIFFRDYNIPKTAEWVRLIPTSLVYSLCKYEPVVGSDLDCQACLSLKLRSSHFHVYG